MSYRHLLICMIISAIVEGDKIIIMFSGISLTASTGAGAEEQALLHLPEPLSFFPKRADVATCLTAWWMVIHPHLITKFCSHHSHSDDKWVRCQAAGRALAPYFLWAQSARTDPSEQDAYVASKGRLAPVRCSQRSSSEDGCLLSGRKVIQFSW